MAAWRDNDDAPIRGIRNGIALSILVWLLIGAVIYTGFHV